MHRRADDALGIQLRDDEAPLDERSDHRLSHSSTRRGEDKPGAWRLSCCVAQADSLDTESEGTRLRLVPKREQALCLLHLP